MGDESVSGEFLEEINLFSLSGLLEIIIILILFASQVQLMNVLLERFHEVILGFLAHDFDLAGDPLIHLLLSLGCVLPVEFLGDLADLRFCANLVCWLIYFLLGILSRIS